MESNDSSSCFAEELQKSLARILKKQEDLCGPFQSAGLSPAFEAASCLLSLNQQEERTDQKRRREKKLRALRRDALQAVQEGDFASLDAITWNSVKPSSYDARPTEGVESEIPGLLMPSLQASELPHRLPLSTQTSEQPLVRQTMEPSSHGWIERAALASVQAKAMMKEISAFDRAQIGAGAGGIAGAITYACLHPLDTIKTKLQARGASQLYSGPLDVIVKTFQKQGILGFYSGISAVLVGSMLSSAVYFGTCELGKALMLQLPSLPPVAVPPIAGALGNIASSAILVPKEVITQRMQTGARGRSWEVFLRTVETEGFTGLYTGYSAALVRNLPASVISFSSFEYLKSAWMQQTGKNQLEPWQSVVSGAIAGVISSGLTTPLDVVKTRLMTQARNEFHKTGQLSLSSMAEAELQAKVAASTYKGITSTIKKIWLEEGWVGLTKGVVPRILYSACFSALGYFAFETARLALVRRHLTQKKKVVLFSSV